MRVPVVVPWRTDNGPREGVWQIIREMWRMNGFDPITHPGEASGPFNRSAAINQAMSIASATTDWQVAIIADADSWVDITAIQKAILRALRTGRLVIAHNGTWISYDADWNEVARVPRGAQSSVIVVRRDLWDKVGGFDERFVGWGAEDRAFHHACLIAAGKPLRVGGEVEHLEHGPAQDVRKLTRENDPQFMANKALARRYLDCPDMESLQALINERSTGRISA